MRVQFAWLVYEKGKNRYAYMGDITPGIIRAGMRVDYRLIDQITTAVYGVLRQAEHIHVVSARGSDLHEHFSSVHNWVPNGGLYHNPDEWGNLPEGEVFTCPDSMDGGLVAEVVGDYFSSKYGLLKEPVTIELEQGFARKVSCANRQLEKELEAYLSAKEYGCRVGEFDMGTNIV